MRASLVVPTRNRAALLALTLPHMLNQHLPGHDHEVIVVDDASTDDTPSVVRQIDDPRVLYTRMTQQRGVAAARNRAVKVSSGDVMIFLDDDTFIAPGFVRRHMAVHLETSRAVVAGGIAEIRIAPTASDMEGAHRLKGYHRHPMPGGNSSVRRGHILAAGGYDEAFDSYGWQDQELAERLLRSGLVRRFAWGATVLHYRPLSVVLDPKHELERELERGRMGAKFYAKHPRALIGITTKMWPPVRALDRLLDGVFGLERTALRILAGERVMEKFQGPHAALLRAHVEISAGRRELARAVRTPLVMRRSGK